MTIAAAVAVLPVYEANTKKNQLHRKQPPLFKNNKKETKQ
ncbi:hypothetical protein P20652_3285 [Pseudoalteromonas sp. BSi20652]|nr:hypothetical protein P20652_3285 [Pseudoalteromonas sp. BSi20652]